MQKRNPNKLPLDLPMPRVRQRTAGYRARTNERIEEIDKTASLLRKMLVAAIIIILVIILKSIDTEFTQSVVGYIRDSITEDMDIDETLGKLKFVTNSIPDSIAVFGQNIGQTQEITPFFSIPAEGKVVGQFGSGNTGIDIVGTKNNNVYSVADGQVMSIGADKNGGQYIKIDHGNDIITLYEGCSQIDVNIGDRVIKGNKIGTMGEGPSGGYALHFEAWVNNKPVDPLKLIETGN